jgi:chromosome segregation ATPase
MMYADINLDEVRRFVGDWRVVTNERSVTEPKRWAEIVRSHQAAQQAIAQQIHTWRQLAQDRLAEIEASLEERVRTAKVPEEQIATERAGLAGLFEIVRGRLNQADLAFDEARGILTALTNAETKAQQRLRELREKYDPVIDSLPSTIHLRWSEVGGQQHLSTPADVERVLAALREQLLAALEQAGAITID